MLGHENWGKEQFTRVKNTDRRAHTCTCAHAHTCTCAHAHMCRNLLCGSDTVCSSEVRWFQTKLHHDFGSCEHELGVSLDLWALPPSTQQQNIRDLGERFALSLWHHTGWPIGLTACGGPWYAGRVTLVTASSGYGSKLNHVSVAVGGYGEGTWRRGKRPLLILVSNPPLRA